MRCLVPAVVFFGLLAGPAAACINDSELPRREWEFRSQYQLDAPPADPAYRPGGLPASPGMVAAVGGLLVVGAIVVGCWPARSR